jgi:hypothetical protein
MHRSIDDYDFFVLSVKPVITCDEKLKEQSLKAQSTLIIMVNISGNPDPTTKWFFGEEELVKSDSQTIESTATMSTLTVKGVTASNAGLYKVVAQNEAGEDSAEFTISIKGNLLKEP